ncbi:hypothetical protein EXIGLDRAFT_723067 [Exidia glandulosa HHB12029]|uniref:Brl1/Brr6 domain-containing protein n=1 Tax=Exidia glandulosa HHB12029 TaxID=1314781 RepID=A0A165EZH6_EXIGL|nr:hypothetical protein EXIGLDRAFT_723067 [Exidia glandulosa HHB12029]
MNGRYEKRSREAPMDFEFTDRDRVNSVFAPDSPFRAALASPKKRGHAELDPSMPMPEPAPFATPQRSFVPNSNAPFLFHSPAPNTPFQNAWTPAPAFPVPSTASASDLADVSMTEASPARDVSSAPAPVQKSPKKKSSKAALQEELGDESDEDNGDEEDDERPISTGALRRAFRGRERERLLRASGSGSMSTPRRRRTRRRNDFDSDDEHEHEDQDVSLAKKLTVYFQPPGRQELAHADVPQVLVGYVQFFFNLAVVLVVLYLAVAFIVTVQRDVEQRVSEYSLELLAEISTCRQQWDANHCASPTHRAPILTAQCAEWEACMARDPTFVGRAKVAAEMMGEVVNGFVEPISWKTLIFTLTSTSFFIVLINVLLSLYRARHAEALALAQHHPYSHGPYPPPPLRRYVAPEPEPALDEKRRRIE